MPPRIDLEGNALRDKAKRDLLNLLEGVSERSGPSKIKVLRSKVGTGQKEPRN